MTLMMDHISGTYERVCGDLLCVGYKKENIVNGKLFYFKSGTYHIQWKHHTTYCTQRGCLSTNYNHITQRSHTPHPSYIYTPSPTLTIGHIHTHMCFGICRSFILDTL